MGESVRGRRSGSEAPQQPPDSKGRRAGNPASSSAARPFDRWAPKLLESRVSTEGFPSGQREQTVNLPALPSKVRILPPPPGIGDQESGISHPASSNTTGIADVADT